MLSSSRGQGNFRGPKASRQRTSKCVLEDVLDAKDVLEDSTSAFQVSRFNGVGVIACTKNLPKEKKKEKI